MRQRERGLLHARHAQPPRVAPSWSATTSTASAADPDGDGVRHRQVAWRDRSVGKGSLVFADERLYLYSENGVVGLAERIPPAYREHGRFTLSTGGASTWSHPILTRGMLILRDQDKVYAFDVRVH